ncbi:hypothetical protein Hanom_Chr02g00142251 [Helianthus anomalus]
MRSRICIILSVVSCTNSGPTIRLSPASSQHKGDRHLRPYRASNVLSFSRIGRKCADFVNRSTITHIISCPLGVLGNFVMKSIETCSHFHKGISGCCSRPDGF